MSKRGSKTAELWKNTEYREHMRKAHVGLPSGAKGKKHSDEARLKNRMAHLGKPSGMKGRHHTEEAKAANAKAHRGRKPHNWIPDRTKLKTSNTHKYDIRYREWARGIKMRDGWKCKLADSTCRGRIEAHHIYPWAKYPAKRYDVTNGIALCRHHHPRKRDDEIKLIPILTGLIQR